MLEKYYAVGNRTFANKYLAMQYAYSNNLEVKFVLFDSVFDRYDWTVEPTLSWNNLLDIRAQQISAKNKKIILGFSGGTDSLTVYQVFLRNNIIPDYLHIRTKPRDIENPVFYRDVLKFIESERKKYNFKVIITEETIESLNEWYSDSDWIWRPGTHIKFINGLSEAQTIEINSSYDSDIDQDYCYVVGLEKPYVKFENGNFITYQLDFDWIQIYDPRICPFFVSPDLPELHAKQCYMLAKYILSLSKKQNKTLSYYGDCSNHKLFNYNEYSTVGCGRFGDIANSYLQKDLNKTTGLFFANDNLDLPKYTGRSLTIFKEGIKENRSYVKNYLDGVRQILSESSFKHLYKNSSNIYGHPSYRSKEYRLNLNIKN